MVHFPSFLFKVTQVNLDIVGKYQLQLIINTVANNNNNKFKYNLTIKCKKKLQSN